MIFPLINDSLDDTPDKTEADGFVGFDAVTEPTKLAPGVVRAGENMWMDVDLLLQTRPGLQFNTLLTRTVLGGGSQRPRGMGYYDIPGFECILAAADGKLLEIQGDGNNVTSTVLAPTTSATADAVFSQLIDRMFWSDGTLHWSLNSAGWTHGTVTTFSDASAMPAWSLIVANNFRLLALDPLTGKIYGSQIGAANTAANWVKTENIRVGSGEGDPTKALINGQAGNLIVINERSAWLVNTTAASVANWTSTRLTALAGCVEGKTAVQAGQDVLFLSAFGVVSLGALSQTISLNPATTISGAVQPYIDRINQNAIATAWAMMWRDHYVLALPLDAAVVPNYFLCFNMTTRKWATPWTSTLPELEVGATTLPFEGFVAGVVSNFGGTQESLIADNTGRVLRLDKAYEKDAYAAASSQEITSWATCKAFTHDIPEAWKQPFWLQMEWFNSTAALVQVNLVRDGLLTYPDRTLPECEIVATNLTTTSTESFPITFPFLFQANAGYSREFSLRNYGRYRNAGVQIVSQHGRVKLRAIRLASFLDAASLV